MSHPRRSFLRLAAAAGVGWIAADVVQVKDALAWATDQAAAGDAARLTALSKADAAAVEAAIARILPAVDGRPGAREVGALFFIDRALATFSADKRPVYHDGIADLNRRAAARGQKAGFAALAPADQDVVLKAIETTPFFKTLRAATIFGTFALPSYGGNRDFAGWHLLGLDHAMSYQPPFGYYDADPSRTS